MASEADTNGYGLFMDLSYTPTLGLSHSFDIDALDENLTYRIWAICHQRFIRLPGLIAMIQDLPPGYVIGP